MLVALCFRMGILDRFRCGGQPASNSGRDIVEKLKSLSPNNIQEMTSEVPIRSLVAADQQRSIGKPLDAVEDFVDALCPDEWFAFLIMRIYVVVNDPLQLRDTGV